MKIRVQVTVNGESSWAVWQTDGAAYGPDDEQVQWVQKRAAGCFKRALREAVKAASVPKAVAS